MLYWLANLIFQGDFIKEIKKILKDKKKLIVFDVGCYKGVFTEKIFQIFKSNIKHIYLFDINRNVRKYIDKIIKNNKITYNECALSYKLGTSTYNYNQFFESAGSSLSNLVKNDKKWNFSRRVLTGDIKNKNTGYQKYTVKTSTLDLFLKKNKINYIDVCKVDIEGSEIDFLKGSKDTLKKNKIKILSLEIMDNKKNFFKKEKKIIDFLKKYNFILTKKNDIYSMSFLSNLKGGDYLFVNKKYSIN